LPKIASANQSVVNRRFMRVSFLLGRLSLRREPKSFWKLPWE